MAGVLPGIALTANPNLDGTPAAGALLYLYQSGGINVANMFRDYALTSPQAWPLEADAFGRLPPFFVGDGIYRARLTDANGVVIYDFDGLVSVGQSSSGTGPGTSVDPTAILTTGDVLWQPKSGTRPGFVRHNARTIGSASSGATERANSDTQSLYTFLYTNFADTFCPVTGGRGASAAADWAANKPIATLDLRGRAPFGLDDMGNTAAGDYSGITFSKGDAVTPGAQAGATGFTLTTANLPPYTPGGAIGGSQTFANLVDSVGGTQGFSTSGPIGTETITVNGSSFSFAGTAQGGTSTPIKLLPPLMLGTWFVKL